MADEDYDDLMLRGVLRKPSGSNPSNFASLPKMTLDMPQEAFVRAVDAHFEAYPDSAQMSLMENPGRPGELIVEMAGHGVNDQRLLSFDKELDFNQPLQIRYIGTAPARQFGIQIGETQEVLARVERGDSQGKREGVIINPTVHTYRVEPRSDGTTDEPPPINTGW